MSMSAYEVVRRAIEFGRPDRLPIKLEKSIQTEKYGLVESDVCTVRWNFIGTGDHRQRQSYDEWGCLWARSEQNNMGQIKGHPLADWSALQHYRWPDPDDAAFYDGMAERFANVGAKYVETHIFMLLFERMQALRGFENILTDLYLERERVEDLADRIVSFDLGIIANLSMRFPGQIHGLWFTEDWGTQQALMVNPTLWRQFFKPRYKLLFEAMHEAGWHIWMHSDGKINVIIDDLIELGVDVINLQQPLVNGILDIGQQFRGRMCFETSCDIQQTLPFKQSASIREEARLLLSEWAAPSGGFVLSIDENESVLQVPAENLQAMLDAFLENSPW